MGVSRRIFILCRGKSVLYQLQVLGAIEGKLVIVADEGYSVAEGVRDDDMVAWVVVFLRLVDFEAGVPDVDVGVNEIPLQTVA